MLIESLRWRQREPSIHEENSPPQAARVVGQSAIILADRVTTNKKPTPRPLAIPLRTSESWRPSRPFMSMLVPNKHPLRKLVPAHR
jgi:hypothetical protein